MTPHAYYNEHDPHAAAWLRELIKDGQIAEGAVDERDIWDVCPADLVGFTRCHFFAGIGGWDYALRLAHWGDRPVWTGSCPCQSFSAAGQGAGMADERHLWPAWFDLIARCRPPVVFGEQVESAIKFGWLDLVCDDLEGIGYAVAAVGLPAACVGALHIRQRIWFVADDAENGREGRDTTRGLRQELGSYGTAGVMAESECAERRAQRLDRDDGRHGPDAGREETHGEPGARREVCGVADDTEPGRTWRRAGEAHGGPLESGRLRAAGKLGEPSLPRLQERVSERRVQRDTLESQSGQAAEHGSDISELGHDDNTRCEELSGHESPPRSAWADCEWLPCRDGKMRPAQPGIFPLAHGVSGRVGLLRGAGNAIVPQAAAEVIAAYLEMR